MKVNIYETIEISEEQRVEIAHILDGPKARKRTATREEIKEFVWERGSEWEIQLEAAFRNLTKKDEDGPTEHVPGQRELGNELEDLL